MINALGEVAKHKLFLNRAAIGIITIIIAFIAGYLPYPILAKFIFVTIWNYTTRFWLSTSALPNSINSLRIALTPLLLIGILLFLLLQKLSSICKVNRLINLRWISLICGWYCLVMTSIVILAMWFDIQIRAFTWPDKSSVFIMVYGHFLNGYLSGAPIYMPAGP